MPTTTSQTNKPVVLETAADQAAMRTVQLIWNQQPDESPLALVRTPSEHQESRPGIKIQTGPQPFKHNHYTPQKFYQHHAQEGTLTNVYGQRLIRVSEDFVVAVLGALEEEVGDAAGEIMYKCGYEWGMEDMKSYTARVQAEFQNNMAQMNTGLLLESWWWPLQIEGWGSWAYDFRQAKQGLLFIDLWESAVAQSIGDIGKMVCYFYAGLFAAVFTVLAKKPLSAIEIQCYSMGEDHCKFLISSSKRVNAAAFWRAEGATTKDILSKVQDV